MSSRATTGPYPTSPGNEYIGIGPAIHFADAEHPVENEQLDLPPVGATGGFEPGRIPDETAESCALGSLGQVLDPAAGGRAERIERRPRHIPFPDELDMLAGTQVRDGIHRLLPSCVTEQPGRVLSNHPAARRFTIEHGIGECRSNSDHHRQALLYRDQADRAEKRG